MSEAEAVYTTAPGDVRPAFQGKAVKHFRARVKKITATDEGRVQIVLETEALDARTIEQVRDLLSIQHGDVLIDVSPEQMELL